MNTLLIRKVKRLLRKEKKINKSAIRAGRRCLSPESAVGEYKQEMSDYRHDLQTQNKYIDSELEGLNTKKEVLLKDWKSWWKCYTSISNNFSSPEQARSFLRWGFWDLVIMLLLFGEAIYGAHLVYTNFGQDDLISKITAFVVGIMIFFIVFCMKKIIRFMPTFFKTTYIVLFFASAGGFLWFLAKDRELPTEDIALVASAVETDSFVKALIFLGALVFTSIVIGFLTRDPVKDYEAEEIEKAYRPIYEIELKEGIIGFWQAQLEGCLKRVEEAILNIQTSALTLFVKGAQTFPRNNNKQMMAMQAMEIMTLNNKENKYVRAIGYDENNNRNDSNCSVSRIPDVIPAVN